jgi:hypothetical protein
MNRKAYESILVLAVVFLAFGFLAGCGSTHHFLITATSGTPQTVIVGGAFAPLVAQVTVNGQPHSGSTVTFTAPSSGASCAFGNGTNTETDTTDSAGNATSSTCTANTTAGSYTVTASIPQVTTTASFDLTNQTAPTYVFYLTGLEANANFYALAGAVAIDANGNVLGGEQDFNDAFGITANDAITGGTLSADGTTLTLITSDASLGVGGTETLGVQFVNANHALVIQFDGSATSSGSLDLQTLANASGNFAFTLSGVDTGYFPIVYGGVFSASSGTLTGFYDVNDDGSVTLGNDLSGASTDPDAFGRGTVTGTGIAGTLAYYIVGPEAIRLIDIDVDSSAVGSAFGQGAGGFTNASLGQSVFALGSNSWADILYGAAGQFTTDGAGNMAGVGDDNEGPGAFIASAAPIAGTYSISTLADGYGSLTLNPGDLGDISSLGIYMTDPLLNLNDPNNTVSGLGGALVVDLDTTPLTGTGVITPQTDTATASFTGNYAFGAQAYAPAFGIGPGWEFDMVANGTVDASQTLTGTGLISDPFGTFDLTPTEFTGVGFAGTATPDGSNPGRYTFSLATTGDYGEVDFSPVIYQADGTQLYWLEEDFYPVVWSGPIEQQPVAGARAKPKRKQ